MFVCLESKCIRQRLVQTMNRRCRFGSKTLLLHGISVAISPSRGSLKRNKTTILKFCSTGKEIRQNNVQVLTCFFIGQNMSSSGRRKIVPTNQIHRLRWRLRTNGHTVGISRDFCRTRTLFCSHKLFYPNCYYLHRSLSWISFVDSCCNRALKAVFESLMYLIRENFIESSDRTTWNRT